MSGSATENSILLSVLQRLNKNFNQSINKTQTPQPPPHAKRYNNDVLTVIIIRNWRITLAMITMYIFLANINFESSMGKHYGNKDYSCNIGIIVNNIQCIHFFSLSETSQLLHM